MNKREYKQIVTLHKTSKVPSKLIIEMILHHYISSTQNIDEAISTAAHTIARFYKEEVMRSE